MSEQPIGVFLAEAIDEFGNACRNAAHTGRILALANFLRRVFQVDINQVAPFVEQYKTHRIHTLRGRPDLPFGEVIVEMKTDILKERENALEELRLYGPLLAPKPTDPIPIGLVTDGFRYEVYAYEMVGGRARTTSDGKFVVSETPIDTFAIDSLTPEEFCQRLDSLLFKQHPVPTSRDLALRFGTSSPTYHVIMGGLQAAYDSSQRSISTRFQQWEKNMGVVYGTSPGVKAFLGHTYLVLLSRLLIDLKINGQIRTDDDLRRSIRGDRLAQYGLGGYEGGYFTWVLDSSVQKITMPLLKKLTDQLTLYDFRNISGDLFRVIYQEIVTTEVRHRTGEYYTPQWLAEMIVKMVIDKNPNPSVIDPACGSGTFLASFIEALKAKGAHLQEILSNVVGIDINPMAVEIARATYLLALGKLLNERVSEIDLPVYVADSLRVPNADRVIETEIPVFRFDVYGETLALPESIAQKEDILLSILREFLSVLDDYEVGRTNRKEAVNTLAVKILHSHSDRLQIKEEWKVLEQTLLVLMNLIDKRKDSIWVFLLRNLYAPARLSRVKFDVVIGNPPWVSLRYIVDDTYQDFVKEQMKIRGLMDPSMPQLATQTELATLFFVEASRLYLKKGGMIAFVMPRSVITGAKQHAAFQRLSRPAIFKIIDLGGVSPVFNVPCCVVMAVNRGKTKYPIGTDRYQGELPGRDLVYSEAMPHLRMSEEKWRPQEDNSSSNESPYKQLFRNGATIVPRCFWFVDFAPHPVMGINPNAPFVKTSSEATKRGKKPWNSIVIQGMVESKYIYASMLGKDISSFVCLSQKPVVLPLMLGTDGLILLDTEDLKKNGDTYMFNWLEESQSYWSLLATKKNLQFYPRLVKYLDYEGKLISQKEGKYAVLFTASGTNVAACMVDREQVPAFDVSGQQIKPNGFFADHKTYIYRTDSEEEALYLLGILNSRVVNETIKPSQSKGSYGPRDIHRRPLDIPFPKFNPTNKDHCRLVELARVAVNEATRAVQAGKKGRKKFVDSLEGIVELNNLADRIIKS